MARRVSVATPRPASRQRGCGACQPPQGERDENVDGKGDMRDAQRRCESGLRTSLALRVAMRRVNGASRGAGRRSRRHRRSGRAAVYRRDRTVTLALLPGIAAQTCLRTAAVVLGRAHQRQARGRSRVSFAARHGAIVFHVSSPRDECVEHPQGQWALARGRLNAVCGGSCACR